MSRTEKFEELKEKSAIMVIAKTNAVKTKIDSYDKSRSAYIMDVAAPPQDNKANVEIIRYLSRLTGKQATIISGATAKKKLIRLN